MSNVVPLVQPIDLSEIISELDDITGPDTTSVCLITETADEIKVRAFGAGTVELLKVAAKALEEA